MLGREPRPSVFLSMHNDLFYLHTPIIFGFKNFFSHFGIVCIPVVVNFTQFFFLYIVILFPTDLI